MSCKKTSIGGQALIEGVMMRGPKLSSMAVRLPDGSIDLETWPTNKKGDIPWYKKTPFIRGIFMMIDSLVSGFDCLMKSADKSGMEEEEPTKFELWLAKALGKDITKIVEFAAVILGVALALVLFIVIPSGISALLRPFIQSAFLLTVTEGVIKMCIFVLYLWATARLQEMRRLYGYHGAEHKTIACYEHGEELIVENVRRHSRFHPRCGTSFLFFVLIISILIGSLITWEHYLLRVILKILLLPVVTGISYEIIKLAGRSDCALTRIISAPGLWIQRLTTREPEDDMIECAIASMSAVIPDNPADDNW